MDADSQEVAETAGSSVMTLSEVADLFKVGDQTVRGWADKGLLRHFRTPGGQRRFWREDVEAFLKDREPAA